MFTTVKKIVKGLGSRCPKNLTRLERVQNMHYRLAALNIWLCQQKRAGVLTFIDFHDLDKVDLILERAEAARQ